jgi:hypothetical protein
VNYLVKIKAAKNSNTTLETLKILATDEYYYVRGWVAQNPNTPPEILEQLATDEYYYVRSHVTRNPNRTELIERLVFMTDYQQEVGKK